MELYQRALGVEVRQQRRRKTENRPNGAWGNKYAKSTREVRLQGDNMGQRGTSPVIAATVHNPIRKCWNCGQAIHDMRDCRNPCGNCRQMGHKTQACLKPCPHCGRNLHTHATCQHRAATRHAPECRLIGMEPRRPPVSRESTPTTPEFYYLLVSLFLQW